MFVVSDSKGLVVESGKRLLATSEFQFLADVPAEMEWSQTSRMRTRVEHSAMMCMTAVLQQVFLNARTTFPSPARPM